MTPDGKFRFTLQFPAETREQIRAGYLLERLGRKKSAVVVAALNEYVVRHFGSNAAEKETPLVAKKSVPNEPIGESIPDSPPATPVEDHPDSAVQQVIVPPMVQDAESASAPEVGEDAFQQAILEMVADLDVFL